MDSHALSYSIVFTSLGYFSMNSSTVRNSCQQQEPLSQNTKGCNPYGKPVSLAGMSTGEPALHRYSGCPLSPIVTS